MIKLQEVQALIELASRGPLTAAERLWLASLVKRLNEQKESDKVDADLVVGSRG